MTRASSKGSAQRVETYTVSMEMDSVWCSRKAFLFAEAAGFCGKERWEVAIAVSELVTNVIKFAGRGTVTLSGINVPRKGIEVIVEDRGPGIKDAELAVLDGYSEGRMLNPDVDITTRRGLGSGLAAVGRLMDELTILHPPEGGTQVIIRKFLRS